MAIDHVGVHVSDMQRARAFYEQALAPLGYAVQMEFPGVVGMGEAGAAPDFWLTADAPTVPTFHLAFRARDRATVDAFYRAAMAAGGADNGPPGLRPHYHPHYYGAFVRDPDGNNVEAVFHGPA